MAGLRRVRTIAGGSKRRIWTTIASRSAAPSFVTFPLPVAIRTPAARACLMSASVGVRARIVHVRFANDTDELSDRVRVRQWSAPVTRFCHDAVSIVGNVPCRLTSSCSTTRAGERLPQAGRERKTVSFVGRLGMVGDEALEDGHSLGASERAGRRRTIERVSFDCPGPGHSAGEGARCGLRRPRPFRDPQLSSQRQEQRAVAPAGSARATDIQTAVRRTAAAILAGRRIMQQLKLEAKEVGLCCTGYLGGARE